MKIEYTKTADIVKSSRHWTAYRYENKSDTAIIDKLWSIIKDISEQDFSFDGATNILKEYYNYKEERSKATLGHPVKDVFEICGTKGVLPRIVVRRNSLSQEVEHVVWSFSTKYEEGFLPEEIEQIKTMFAGINEEKFQNAMMGNTCMMKEGKFVIYPCDIAKAIVCGIENRELTAEEWD